MNNARIKIGDMFEIKVSKGFAYAIYTNKHVKPPRYGPLIRVFDKIFSTRPANIDELINLPIMFMTFFPLQAAINKEIFEIIGNVRVPDEFTSFPTFRAGAVNPKTKLVASWWLWDGEKEWRIGSLTPEQRKLPIRGVWNDTYLIDRIDEGWRPELDRR